MYLKTDHHILRWLRTADLDKANKYEALPALVIFIFQKIKVTVSSIRTINRIILTLD